MPTLRPQKLSGLVVIPTVEQDPGIWRVSVAVDVGSSRTPSPPPDVVTREDLVVELRNAAEGSFEAIASPDPGPLPVRALRVVQARGEFTFAQGVNAPDELVVALRGDRKSFPLSQTLSPSAGFTTLPQVGDPFPTGFRLPLRLVNILGLRRGRCCVQRFDAPLNVNNDPAAKSGYFEIEADFAALGKRCRCSCCEYRQFVRGTFSDSAGGTVRFDMATGPLDPNEYREDGRTQEFDPKHGFYGHRDTSSPGDDYSAGTPRGCSYRGNEKASSPPTEGVYAEFVGLIVDRCQRKVVAVQTWGVDL
jgi:hypothetical protein